MKYFPVKLYDKYILFYTGKVYNTNKNKFLKPWLNKTGYKYVSLNSQNFSIHRLIGLNFIPNPENKRCIDHINR